MRILVYPHDMAIGGSQLNAIEIAAQVARRGHEVTVFGASGSLVSRVDELGLDFVESPAPWRRPSPPVLKALTRTIREREIDVVHGYEWPPILESWIAARHTRATAFGTVMSMAVAGFLPRFVPLLVGTEQIAATERLWGRTRVEVLEPPVDLSANHPTVAEGGPFRAAYGIAADELAIVTVTRLAHEMKLEGILVAIDLVGDLARDHPVRLVVVGDGPAAAEVEARAKAVNAAMGRPVIVLTGQLADPRPAYAGADVVLGMGSSALRAMAFGKPLIVQGEQGFWSRLGSETVEDFLWTGWYGVGPGRAAGPRELRAQLDPLVSDRDLRRRAGRYSLALVRQRFSLTEAAKLQERQYEMAVGAGRERLREMTEAARSTALYSSYFAGRYVAKARGRVTRDDFNGRPVAAREDAAPCRRKPL